MATQNQNVYKDESLFPYGKAHKNKRFDEVPADYFEWIYDNKAWREDLCLHAYIEDNIDCFERELGRKFGKQ